MTSPDYIRILKLDKIAMKSKTRTIYLEAAKACLQFARNLEMEKSFPYFVEQAWLIFSDDK